MRTYSVYSVDCICGNHVDIQESQDPQAVEHTASCRCGRILAVPVITPKQWLTGERPALPSNLLVMKRQVA